MTGNRFVDEEVESQYGYRSGYQPKSLDEQILRLYELFPELGTGGMEIVNLSASGLPLNAEGLFAIPRWKKIEPTYNLALEKVFKLIAKARDGKFSNFRKGDLGPNRLRQNKRTVEMFKKLGDQQKSVRQQNDILIVPAQFGLRHRGRSVRRARSVFNAREFGLDAFAVGIMLLTHPERLKHYDDLWIACAGDDYDEPDVDSRFSHAPYFYFNAENVVGFGFHCCSFDHAVFGSASGFVF